MYKFLIIATLVAIAAAAPGVVVGPVVHSSPILTHSVPGKPREIEKKTKNLKTSLKIFRKMALPSIMKSLKF